MADEAVAVVGAGSWGTTMAALVATRAPTTLWSRSPGLAASTGAEHENRRYLPGVALPEQLAVTSDLEDVAGASIVLMAVPSHGFRAVLGELARVIGSEAVVVSLAKGIEERTNLRMTEVVAEVLPDVESGVLTGPNLAREVAECQPTTSVVAMRSEAGARRVQSVLHTNFFRVYTATDVVGCEIAGATKNVLAIAAGVSDGLGFGENHRASLITRGLAELGRLGVCLGGERMTFAGLAGVGDLVATCTSPKSRNRTVGFELGQGRSLDEVIDSMQMVAEGVKTARPLVDLAREHDVELPICEQVAMIVQGRASPVDALDALMGRPARAETDER